MIRQVCSSSERSRSIGLWSQDGRATKPVETSRNELAVLLFQLQVNSSAVFAIGYLISYGCLWKTVFFGIFLISLGTLRQFAGAHRLWAHASYKANTGLRLFLMLCQTLVGHGSIYEWVRWHRLHHKYIGTDLDPYNSKSGFFQAQFISLTMDLSPAQQEALKEIDVTDLENDKIVMF
ncbi:hypothetical protein HUJ04_011851 [Dendroctonus ponderosae]|nr:hypothetical protein HUJ04_011851 [Dendroctonus ponderosae]